MLKFLIKIQL